MVSQSTSSIFQAIAVIAGLGVSMPWLAAIYRSGQWIDARIDQVRTVERRLNPGARLLSNGEDMRPTVGGWPLRTIRQALQDAALGRPIKDEFRRPHVVRGRRL